MRSVPLLIMLGASLLPAATRAQEALLVEHRGKLHPVRAALRNQPYVEDSGKRVLADGNRYTLRKVDEYLPFFISIRNLKVGSRHLELINEGAEINRTFEFSAEFESPFGLENVFVVLDLDSADAGKTLFLWEIGTPQPRRPKEVTLHVPMSLRLGEGKYKIHLFTDGFEVFHSKMPWTYVESTLDRMVARRIKGAPDAIPKPYVGPGPEYPSKLLRAKTKGEAVIAFTVSRNGRVVDPQVASASDPAFGESALAAARLWRFLPRIVNGAPTETKVNMPFVFTP
jgi:TonB family protein